MESPIPTRVVPSVATSDMTTRQVASEFRGLVDDGMSIRPAGEAKRDPLSLLSRGYTPKYKIEFLDTAYYLTNVRQNQDIRFTVAYVVQRSARGRGKQAFPRLFYKDISLIWRAASHFIRSEDENWIGKGDYRVVVEDGVETVSSVEETTDLPLEIQTAVEGLIRKSGRIRRDETALALVLRRGHDNRIEAYNDFIAPRRKAQADPRNLVNRGRPIASFDRRGDPTSLRFAAGFEPDFAEGVLEITSSTSKLYGGALRRYRILSRNRVVQYLFIAGPHQAWIIPPQATTTEIMSFGVRTIDVIHPEDLCIPGYEYHFIDETEDPPQLISQIPEGFAGEPNEFDSSRADASPWLDRLPVIREFRRVVPGGS